MCLYLCASSSMDSFYFRYCVTLEVRKTGSQERVAGSVVHAIGSASLSHSTSRVKLSLLPVWWQALALASPHARTKAAASKHKSPLDAGLAAERANFALAKSQAVELGCVPFMRTF